MSTAAEQEIFIGTYTGSRNGDLFVFDKTSDTQLIKGEKVKINRDNALIGKMTISEVYDSTFIAKMLWNNVDLYRGDRANRIQYKVDTAARQIGAIMHSEGNTCIVISYEDTYALSPGQRLDSYRDGQLVSKLRVVKDRGNLIDCEILDIKAEFRDGDAVFMADGVVPSPSNTTYQPPSTADVPPTVKYTPPPSQPATPAHRPAPKPATEPVQTSAATSVDTAIADECLGICEPFSGDKFVTCMKKCSAPDAQAQPPASNSGNTSHPATAPKPTVQPIPSTQPNKMSVHSGTGGNPVVSPSRTTPAPKPVTTASSPVNDGPGTSIVFIIDTSGSMAEDSSEANSSKMQEAKNAFSRMVDEIRRNEKNDEYALMYFDNCGTKSSLEFTKDLTSIQSTVMRLYPSGATPLANTMRKAADFIMNNANGKKGRIIVLSDGQNSSECGGDPVEAASYVRKIIKEDIPTKYADSASDDTTPALDVIGFGVEPGSEAEAELKNVAQAGGGNYYTADNAEELAAALMAVTTIDINELIGAFIDQWENTKLAKDVQGYTIYYANQVYWYGESYTMDELLDKFRIYINETTFPEKSINITDIIEVGNDSYQVVFEENFYHYNYSGSATPQYKAKKYVVLYPFEDSFKIFEEDSF